MKANELRIGNYAKDPYGKTIKLVSVEKDASMLTPIILTEEWLLKFGVLKIDSIFYLDDYVFILYRDQQLIEFCINLGDGNYVLAELSYVHTFQNLYFALTEKELTI